MTTATGTFEVKSSPLPADAATESLGAMRMMFEKNFSGALRGRSVVSMLGMMDRTSGSGAYVALERFEGTLDGRQGSFCLQHSSTMNRGVPEQSITVVPDSATGDLEGLTGTFKIDITAGLHSYEFNYSL